ncbi:MAG: HNH endonuclease [Chloroflexi bacterium]|nr:HNH endonuclease [Chloroflexota bacterium]
MRQKVLNRASGRCQYPGCPFRGRLHVHHIDMNPSNSRDEENLIAVCPNHHDTIHKDTEVTQRQVRQWAHGQYGRRRA